MKTFQRMTQWATCALILAASNSFAAEPEEHSDSTSLSVGQKDDAPDGEALAEVKSEIGPNGYPVYDVPVYINIPVDQIEPVTVPGPQGFVCEGEPKSVVAGMSNREIKLEIAKRVSALNAREVHPGLVAHYHCVVAELMVYTGNFKAEDYFKRAIALHPNEPAYELFYARYLQGRRGAANPLTEDAERHNYRALEKLKSFKGVGQTGSTNEVAYDWTRKNLYMLYLADGFPILPWQWKAYPYKKDATDLPQAYVAAWAGGAKDTNDMWELADSRKFTGELQVYLDRNASNDTVTDANREEVTKEIARAPLRWNAGSRVRVRQNILGAFDFSFERSQILDAQPTDFAKPLERNDIDLQEIAVRWRRSFNMGQFDMTLDAGASQQTRLGIVEHEPDEIEQIYVYQANPTVSRFVGPDKLTIGGTYVFFDTPNFEDAPVDEQIRERVLRGAFIDYAFYRPIIMPQLGKGTWVGQRMRTRGWHWFAAVMTNDETFGSTVIKKTDVTAGTAFKGLGDYNITLTGTRYWGSTIVSRGESEAEGVQRVSLDNQRNSQYRTNLILLRRIVDPDITPGMPRTLQSLSVTVPLRHDIALEGPDSYENFRGGLQIWALLSGKALRGTGFLVNAGIEYQNFYNIGQELIMGQINVRMGWPYFGNIPAYN